MLHYENLLIANILFFSHVLTISSISFETIANKMNGFCMYNTRLKQVKGTVM